MMHARSVTSLVGEADERIGELLPSSTMTPTYWFTVPLP